MFGDRFIARALIVVTVGSGYHISAYAQVTEVALLTISDPYPPLCSCLQVPITGMSVVKSALFGCAGLI